MNRRDFLAQLAAASTLPVWALAEGSTTSVPPFRVIYSNDTTHTLSCLRPEERRRVGFTDGLLRKSITEAGGVDAHFLQPGLGWIPWWQSKIYSPEDHQQWLRETYGINGISLPMRYLLDGGDMLQTLVDTCREIGVAPFLSFRLNDGHHTRDLAAALEQGRPTPKMARHYWENYEAFRIGPDVTDWGESVFDWAIPEVRDYKFSLMEEACRNYDIAGLELDFLRHWVRFRRSTPLNERQAITTDFVRRVRKMLDRTAAERGLPHRWLCVRVPAAQEVRPEQGIDLQDFARVGVEMVNLSYSYFTWQDRSIEHAVREIDNPHVAVYAEMTHCTLTGKATAGSGTQPYLRTTDAQFYTTAELAHSQGARGVSLFNFPYYRYHVTDSIGPFHEPPFHVLPRLKDQEFLRNQSRWYFISSGRNDPILGDRQLPRIVKRSHPETLTLDVATGVSIRGDGIFRVRSDEPIADREIEVTFNGQPLSRTGFIKKPLPHPYDDTWLGTPDEVVCYTVPTTLTLAETNRIEVNVRRGERVRVIYADLVLP